MSGKFFISTPIYYSNDIPHIGHAYSSLIADTLARYHRSRGEEVKFTTGVDENSQKVVEKASEKGLEVFVYADMMAGEHRKVWDALSIGYTDFVRTTEERHRDFVQSVLQKSYDAGDIYEGTYDGLYCVGCEAFKKESDLVDGRCSDHPNKPLQHLSEKNYFFRLSKYQDRLLAFYASHPEFVTPSNRYHEIVEFVKGGLEDFSVSRETNKFGIPLPFDPTQVTYVWYDALFNYLTYCQEDEAKWWPADIHVIGKDIVRFHGIYWPAMLWSAGYEAPHQLLTTGFFTIDGQKMSKSIGNVINPVEYINSYSRDLLALYLFSAFPIGEDGDFDREQAILIYNAKLSNNLGNLLNRVIALSLKIGGKLDGSIDPVKKQANRELLQSVREGYDRANLKGVLDMAFAHADVLNLAMDQSKPWKMDIETEYESYIGILTTVASGLQAIAYALTPIFPEKMTEILVRLGVGEREFHYRDEEIVSLPDAFFIGEKGEPLYQRAELINA